MHCRRFLLPLSSTKFCLQAGKKNAIAETMAMMNKMRLEDKERKEVHSKVMEARKKEMAELAARLSGGVLSMPTR